ncbi:alpha/beta fold hydrolase [Kamptonema sp. UHCC 0994]|uniref:alpha/beta fold hydrolase n=1 Tax=Kamptonema sp. UHCC 0994 TaxID=3031329 RepID=UPI0023B954A4|nr:alpha/beta fold hydrolase [Kamptonema sp. UHCC 0994]MDF0552792.1 alpha/beta fold hydrolase [Kamptonema sp. UHCC 0994]
MLRLEASLTTSGHWHQRIGLQRDWVWRGWQTRYTYLRPTGQLSQLDQKSQETEGARGRGSGGAEATDESDTLKSYSPQFPFGKEESQNFKLGTPLILLHGFGASIGHWRHNLAQLAEFHTVYALDLLGFGASQKAPANYDVSIWVAQVYEFWQTFIRQPVVLVGNSIGSLICLAAAAAHPDMVAGIVMISLPDPSVRAEAVPLWLQPAIAAVENIFASPPVLRTLFYFVRRPSIVRRWVSFAYANPDAISDELVEILSGPTGDRGSARAFCALFKAVGSAQFGPGVKTVLPELKIPILLIWGQQDRMIPPRFARPRQFMEYNSNLKLVELENAGHCPHDECPERVNQEILNWIAIAVEDKGAEN